MLLGDLGLLSGCGLMYKPAERAFSRMFALKPADEFGLAISFCPKEPGVSLFSHLYGETL
jgi:hypothetical protein